MFDLSELTCLMTQRPDGKSRIRKLKGQPERCVEVSLRLFSCVDGFGASLWDRPFLQRINEY